MRSKSSADDQRTHIRWSLVSSPAGPTTAANDWIRRKEGLLEDFSSDEMKHRDC
jgi:hypothetical protein